MTQNSTTGQSGWQEAGFPFGFRFRNPTEIFLHICKAMAERSMAQDHIESTLDTDGLRLDERAVTQDPGTLNRLDYRHRWSLGYEGDLSNMWYFLKDYIFKIAGCYCDADKAYDFESYPELENWTPESLEDKLKENYVKFTAFCNKEKYLMFLYRVLNLCSVRRVSVAQSAAGGLSRRVTTNDKIFYYDEIDDAMKLLKSKDFHKSNFLNQKFKVSCNYIGRYELEQNSIRFLSWVDDKRPCDMTFYGFATDEGIDEFSPLGVENVALNKWFCAGKADIYERVKGVQAAAVEFKFPDSEIPAVPRLAKNECWTKGFSLKEFRNSEWNSCYGMVVRDQRNYLKYFERQTNENNSSNIS